MAPSTPVSNTTGYDDPVVAQQARNMTKAIFQYESGTNYNATGDAGTSTGAGQWQPDTWKAQAKDVLGDENAPMTQQNQSVVAQGTIRKLIKEGKNAAQIAAIWNSGNDTNWENKVGTTTINGQQIKYNVPKYVKGVTDLYQHFKSGGTQPGTMNATGSGVTPTGEPALSSLGSNVSKLPGEVMDISNKVANTVAPNEVDQVSSALAGIAHPQAQAQGLIPTPTLRGQMKGLGEMGSIAGTALAIPELASFAGTATAAGKQGLIKMATSPVGKKIIRVAASKGLEGAAKAAGATTVLELAKHLGIDPMQFIEGILTR